jgi:hypothetical protein
MLEICPYTNRIERLQHRLRQAREAADRWPHTRREQECHQLEHELAQVCRAPRFNRLQRAVAVVTS